MRVMTSSRLLLALFLLAGMASAQDHAELRKLINGYRNTVERQRVELVLPKRVAAVPAGAVLSIGFRGTLLWLDPVGDRVCITQLRHGLIQYSVVCLKPDFIDVSALL